MRANHYFVRPRIATPTRSLRLNCQDTGLECTNGVLWLFLHSKRSLCTNPSRQYRGPVLTLDSTFTCISVVPIAGSIVTDLDGAESNGAGSILLVTIWELGEAAGPLLIAPLSELFGRYPVFNVANFFFICGTVLSASSQSVNFLVFARFLTGCAVASNVLNPAVIGDIFPTEQRGSAMSVIMLAPLLGGAVGPAVAGIIAQSAGWRHVLWMALVLSIACELAFLTLFRETYGVVLEKKRRQAIASEESHDSHLVEAVHEAETALWASIVRPARVLYSSVVLQSMSVYGSLVFSFFYIMSTTLPDILHDRYGLPPSLVGTSFLTFSIGSVLGVAVCNQLLDRIYRRAQNTAGMSKPPPEARLQLMIFGAFLFPLVVGLYGWVAELILPLPLMLFCVALMGFTMMLTVLPMMAYVVDAFNLYSASAMTAVLISRCLMGTFLPLVTAPLRSALGYGWGFTILAAMCAILAPVPALISRFGGKLRGRSKYTRDA
ncbi:major facilitator superfamily transporter [Clohesyomyces aquaticus]|uniref:Major facilitator superfamily transporter n=1 Tax=Clohesyomyces aquaticus TaxID=1231657 RepID=A0A1Y1ZT49_9PLEO|nr:major facilitator superfamily transporter [Clohesyomyces aquaticus]